MKTNEDDFSAAHIGGGRELPPLLFATSAAALEAKFGASRVRRILAVLREAGHEVVDVPMGTIRAEEAAIPVWKAARRASPAGIVVLGGYDVLPAQYVDCLPGDIRRKVEPQVDPWDDFLLWSDDVYGDLDSDIVPEFPVSRIPDGNDIDLMIRCLTASPAETGRAGLRNVNRSFADAVFKTLPGTAAMATSEPYVADQQPTHSLRAERVYLVLHGLATDGTRYWGESRGGAGDDPEALRLAQVPPEMRGVVLAGACWGALLVDEKAKDYSIGQRLTPRTAQNSIALAFLRAGALAFIGTTGAHHSPLEPPYRYFSGALHRDFWAETIAGSGPAQALHRAKALFGNGLPHNRGTVSGVALELKTLRQFTCLGLGW